MIEFVNIQYRDTDIRGLNSTRVAPRACIMPAEYRHDMVDFSFYSDIGTL